MPPARRAYFEAIKEIDRKFWEVMRKICATGNALLVSFEFNVWPRSEIV